MELGQIIKFRDERYVDLERFGKLIKQFLAWDFVETYADSMIPSLQDAQTRVKSISSIRRNFRDNVYSGFSTPCAIPDLVGVRLIVHFLDDLYEYCSPLLLKQKFGHHSLVSFEDYSDDSGYKSLHFEVKLDTESEFLQTLKAEDQTCFKDLNCEVQIRTVIQHAFAESNHLLNYKYQQLAKSQLPEEDKRSWKDASLKLDDVDDKITQLKQKWAGDSRFRRTNRMETEARFSYKGDSEYSKFPSLQVYGVTFGYQMQLGSSSKNLPAIEILENSFNIDEVFQTLTGVDKYKSKMWKQLENNKPENIRNITHDSVVPRIVDWDEQRNVITVQRAMYSDQVVSNHKFALDELIPETQSMKVRDLAFDSDGQLLNYSQSPFSNTIGVCCIVKTRDNKWIVSHRGNNVAFDPGALGCSASGALEWDELGNWGEKTFLSWFAGGMVREYVEELGGDASAEESIDTLSDKLIFLGFGRELERCGKPQAFFFVQENTKDFSDIRKSWRIYANNMSLKEGENPEFKDIIGLPTEDLKNLVSANETLVNSTIEKYGCGSNVSEELRANAVLALKYLEDTHN